MNSWVRKSAQGCAPVEPSARPWACACANSARRRSRWAAVASLKVSPLPLRISISDLMSSPLIDSASGPVAASRSSSKRGTMSRVRGSRTANSSSRPTVPSFDVAKTSTAASRLRVTSSRSRARRAGRPPGTKYGRSPRAAPGAGVGVVEDDLDAGVDELVGELLGRGRRHGEDADDDVLLLDDAAQVVDMTDGLVAHALADLVAVGVEDRHDAEAVVGEDVRAGDRPPEVPGAEERD